MKYIVTIFFTLQFLLGYSQTTKTEKSEIDTVTFTVKVQSEKATKDGLYLSDGSVLNISPTEVLKLDGKTIEVIGTSYVVKGLNSLPKIYDDNGNEIYRQGRAEDTQHFHIIGYKIIKE